MATTTLLSFCPKCNAELPVGTKEKCPTCSTIIYAKANKYFDTPDYLWYQRDDQMANFDPTHNRSQTKVLDLTKIEEVEDELVTWARNCPADDRIAALRDAQLLLSNSVHAPLSARELQQITSLGKEIGKLSQSIEEFFRHGGSIYDRKAGRVRPLPTDDNGGNEATG